MSHVGFVLGVVLVSLLLTYFTPCFSVSIVNFEQVNAGSKLSIATKYVVVHWLFL